MRVFRPIAYLVAERLSFRSLSARVLLYTSGLHVFKRIVEGNAQRTAVWVVTGGADASSPELEARLEELYHALNGTAGILTMDQRGTGNSSPLECEAVDDVASGAPIDFNAVTNCINGHGDIIPEAFSITRQLGTSSTPRLLSFPTVGTFMSTDLELAQYSRRE
ncbi:hypothetical protein Poli38472_014755 [Pythium oligandrum]|uniref:Uncharacterized protein n=1 Tax=Pythium oligandrum TaxID=41045 RepID=A0A8K1C205_PYTOL|nr:hypothetical protein Poli38472_014755 [Pythium oligandrum]|eukprot:TMW54984.1 hypothetical protein Poli38472_014755 [Pythium oligandrum]